MTTKPEEKIVTKVKTVYKIKLDKEMALVSAYIKYRSPKMPIEIADRTAYEVLTQSREAFVSWELVMGIIECESFFYPSAISPAGASGLMQILRAHKITIDHNKKYDIAYNIEMGIKILKLKCKKAKGNLEKTLEYYSGGAKKYNEKVIYQNMGQLMLFTIHYKEKLDNEKKKTKEK